MDDGLFVPLAPSFLPWYTMSAWPGNRHKAFFFFGEKEKKIVASDMTETFGSQSVICAIPPLSSALLVDNTHIGIDKKNCRMK